MLRYLITMAIAAAVPFVFAPMYFATIPFGNEYVGIVKVVVAVLLFVILFAFSRRD